MNTNFFVKLIKIRKNNIFLKLIATGIIILFISSLLVLSSFTNSNILRDEGNNNFTRDFLRTNFEIHTENINVTKQSKVLCYILLQENKLQVAKLINETWGQFCDHLVFYGNFVTPSSTSVHVTFINATEGYPLLWGKTKAALIHLKNNYSPEYEWFIKADHDTFIVIQNLRDFIAKNVSPKQKMHPLWFGFKMRHMKMKHGYMSGGAAYVFNSHALTKFVSLLEENTFTDYIKMDSNSGEPLGCKTVQNNGIEDLELGRCFHAIGVKDVVTLDTEGKERFLPLSLSKLMSGDVPAAHWLWRQAYHPFKPGKNCCGSSLISIHEVSPSELKILYFLLYKLKLPSSRPQIINR